VPFTVSTLSFITKESDKTYDADLKAGRLVHVAGLYDRNSDGKDVDAKVYGITPGFIRYYWRQFPADSFVFVNSCSSTSAGAADFISAIKSKQASVYAGWSKPSGWGFETSEFVFDRLLGGNHVYPESDGFKQRPFDYNSVASDFPNHRVGKDPETGADLEFVKLTDSPATGFQTLAPSIEEMDVDELTDTVEIVGIFGDDPGPGNRVISIGGQEVNVEPGGWQRQNIYCDLPKSGPGSAGEVIVKVYQHKSNTAYLSEWQGTFTHTVMGNGTLKQTTAYNVHFRGDIRDVRYTIHEPPRIAHLRGMLAMADSTLDYESSGLYAVSSDTVESWSGGPGQLQSLALSPSISGFFNVTGTITNSTGLALTFEVTADDKRIVTVTGPSGVTTSKENLLVPAVPTADITVSLDTKGNIVANTLTGRDSEGAHTLTWNLITNKYPPDPNSPR